MLINSKDRQATVENNRLNEQSGAAGAQMQAEAKELQSDVQGAISDIVRKNEAEGNFDPTDEIGNYLESLSDQAPKAPDRNRPVTADRYVTINGRLTLVKRGRR